MSCAAMAAILSRQNNRSTQNPQRDSAVLGAITRDEIFNILYSLPKGADLRLREQFIFAAKENGRQGK